MKLVKHLGLIVVFAASTIVAGCSEEKLPENATIYQKAEFNKERPSKDRKSDKARRPGELFEFAGIKPGMKVADLSAGDGYLTEILSHIVGEKGKVYMQIDPRYLSKYPERIDDRLASNRLPNVVRVDSKIADQLNLPQGLDFAVSSNVFHDLYVGRQNKDWNADVDKYISEVYNALNVGGKFLIIDHSAADGTGSSEARTLHRIEENFVKNLLESKGFKLSSMSDMYRNPQDTRKSKIFDSKIRGKTDKFVLVFEKVAQ